jgi:chromosomal replication initiator protein
MTQEESIAIAAWAQAQDYPCQYRVLRDDAETAALIVTEVCTLMHVDARALLGKSRPQHIAVARQVAAYAMRELTEWSYPQIGLWFGRHHTTVLWAHQAIGRRIAAEVPFRRLVEGLLARVSQ